MSQEEKTLTLDYQSHEKYDLKKSIYHYVAQMSADKIDSRVVLNGTEFSNNTNEMFRRSDLKTNIAKQGYNLSIVGKYFILLTKIDKEWYTLTYEIPGDEYTSVGRDIKEITLNGGSFIKINGSEYSTALQLRVLPQGSKDGVEDVSGRIEMITGYLKDGAFAIFEDYDTNNQSIRILYDKTFMNKIPGVIVRNNPNSIGDLERVEAMIDLVSNNLDKIPQEYEWMKTLLGTNESYGAGDSVDKLINNIEKGDRKMTNAVLGSGQFGGTVGLFSQGGSVVEIILTIMGSILDLVYTLSLTPRDSDSSGTNKHGSEIALFNQSASEYYETKRKQRIEDLSFFFTEFVSKIDETLHKRINSYDEASVGWELSFEESTFEQGKKDKLLEQGYINQKIVNEASKSMALAQKAESEANLNEKALTEPKPIIKEKEK